MYIVDRIEGTLVVCEREDKTMIDLEKALFPKEIKAGDVVCLEDGRYRICIEETQNRTKKIQAMMNSLWED